MIAIAGYIASLTIGAPFIIFLVPKFIASWSIPQLTHLIAPGAPSNAMAWGACFGS